MANTLRSASQLARGAAVFALALGTWPAHGQSSKAIPEFGAIFPGQVNAMEEAGGVLYVGGNFSEAYKPSGPFSIMDKTSGSALAFPMVAGGSVDALARDGAGGWFLGGSFTSVGGFSRAGAAHILADGRLSDWNPGVGGGSVLALQPAGAWVYLGGTFSSVGSFGRSRLARVSIATGAVDAAWDPSADNTVRDLDLRGNTLYAAGDFTTLNAGGTSRGRVAAFDAVTGALDPSWNPNADAVVRVVRANNAGTGVYVGGDFVLVGGSTHPRLTILEPAGGGNVGNVLGWLPTVDNSVYALTELGSTVYFGGTFSVVNSTTRNKLAAVNAFPSSANLLGWNPDPLAVWVFAVETDGTNIYAGGDLSQVGSGASPVARRGVAALPATGSGLPPLGFDPSAALIDANDAVNAMAFDGSRLAIGGSFDGFDLRDRSRLAAFDVSTGNLASWAPPADSAVYAMDVFGSTIYVGGVFTMINGTPRGGLAALNTAGGLLAFAPSLSGSVATAFALVVSGVTPDVYVGGDFTSPRDRLAKFNGVSGALDTGFAPGAPLNTLAPTEVRALDVSGGFLHVGGRFTSVGGTSRQRLAALSTSSGALDAWDPIANNEVNDLARGSTQMYFAGLFTTLDSPAVTRNRAAGTSFADGTSTGQPPSSWDPNVGASVANALAPLPSGDVAIAGAFTTVGGSARSRFASVDAAAGTLRAWNPNATGGNGTALAVGPKRLYAGGTFQSVGGQKRYGLAAFCLTNTPGGLSATAGGNNQINLTWAGAAPSYNVYRATRSGGPYAFLANATGTAFNDIAVDGGVTYFYVVKGLDTCESDPSSEAAAATSGGCGSAPEFEGAAGAAESPAPLCGTTLTWAPAVPLCGTGVHYSVYRSTSPSFTPDISNRLVAGLGTVKYTDTSSLVGGTQYFYVARAQHDSNGQEDQNLIRLGFLSPTCTLTAPEPVHVFTVTSRDAENVIDWLRPTIGYNQTVVRVCGPGSPGCGGGFPANSGDGDAVTMVGGPAGQPFEFTHSPLTNGATYKYAAFAQDGAGTDATAAGSFGRPASATLYPKWGFASGASALTPVGVLPSNRYVAVSNDRNVHALGAGAAGPESGNWPTGWTPFAMNGPAQARPTIVTIGGTPTAFVSSQDGRLYALNANTGAPIWTTGALGASIQASASVRVGAPNLVFVGTRDLAGSQVYGLNFDTQSVSWTFSVDELARPLGIISGQPALDLSTSRLYFASRAKGGGGSPHTVWCLPFTGGPAVWTRDLEDVDAAVAVLNGRVYAGTTNGKVYALNTSDGSNAWTVAFDTGTGQAIQDLIFVATVDATRWRLYFTAGGRVFGLEETFSTTAPVPFWPAAGIPIPNASAPLVRLPRVFVGGSNSRVYGLDGNNPTPPPADEVVVGEPASPKILGRPTFDVTGNLLLVGSDQGVVYSVAPFP